MSCPEPLMITVAPNGARKTRSDHPALPISPRELASTARECLAQGACMIHLHVRNDDFSHSLNVQRYRSAIDAIRCAVGPELIIQVTTEAVGMYSVSQQMQVVRELRPEAVSLAVRELCPGAENEEEAGQFFAWLKREHISPQYILYSAEDITRYNQLRQHGVIPAGHNSVLYVLGRYSAGQLSSPQDLLPMLAAAAADTRWSVCAFGPSELPCLLAAAALGGHCRVGFENNMSLNSGVIATDNAALVAQLRQQLDGVGRRPMTPTEARALLGI